MENILFLGYVLLCVLPALIIVSAVCRAAARKKANPQPRADWIKLLVFAAYTAGVLFFTGAGTLYHIRQYGLGADALQYNVVPFSAAAIDIEGYLLNIVLFLPLGFLLPLIWPENDRLGRVLLFGAALSLVIELSQLLNIRSTDIDDLLLNTLGALLGFLLFRLYRHVFRRESKPAHSAAGRPALYLAAMYCGYFFLFNEFGFAKLLYGF